MLASHALSPADARAAMSSDISRSPVTSRWSRSRPGPDNTVSMQPLCPHKHGGPGRSSSRGHGGEDRAIILLGRGDATAQALAPIRPERDDLDLGAAKVDAKTQHIDAMILAATEFGSPRANVRSRANTWPARAARAGDGRRPSRRCA